MGLASRMPGKMVSIERSTGKFSEEGLGDAESKKTKRNAHNRSAVENSEIEAGIGERGATSRSDW